MKKVKTKKPRANRRTRAERKRNPGRSAPAATLERSQEESTQGSREQVYLRFGEPPESGISRNGIGLTRGYEAGVSCYLGWRVRTAKGSVSYVIDIPRELRAQQLIRQGQYLVIMVMEGRPVYVLEGGEDVGVGADGEPVLAGATPKLIPSFARVLLPEWLGEKGRTFAGRWNRVRGTPKYHTSLDVRAAGLNSLRGLGEALTREVTTRAVDIVEERGLSHEELLDTARSQEEARAAGPEGKQNYKKNPLLTPEQKRAWSGEGPRVRIIDPLDFESQERRLRLALGEDPEEERTEAVSGEGVPLVERVLSRATVAARNSKIHGPEHWQRVAVAGLELCRETPGADPSVVLNFALFHDSQRYTDNHDPGHGRRGGAMARELLGEDKTLSAVQVEQIINACDLHTAGQVSPDPTIGVCWDADRLNLWRVASRPSPVLLSTEAARSLERIEWARELQEECFTWLEIFERYADFNPDERGDEVA